MVTWLGHCTVLDGRRPVFASAEAVTTLKVEPGGNSPWSARSKPPGRSITASTLPVEGWMATRSMGFAVAADRTACDAARQRVLVCLLDPALADLVTGPVWGAERLGLGGGRGHHGAGQ